MLFHAWFGVHICSQTYYTGSTSIKNSVDSGRCFEFRGILGITHIECFNVRMKANFFVHYAYNMYCITLLQHIKSKMYSS